MIRIFLFILALALAAAGLTALLSVEGNVDIRFGQWAYNASATATLIAGALAILLLIVVVLMLSYFMRLPTKLKAMRKERERHRGVVALTRGLEAVAAGDATDAQRHARSANRHLEEPGLTRLLTAQAAQLAGDYETAERTFAEMLDAPETEFLGLRGLYLQAIQAGDRHAATEYAERAFKLRPNARWAYDSVYQLSVERGAWSEARSALKLAAKNGLEEGDHVKRREAALITARAYAADAAGDADQALSDAKDAVKLAPDFPPAATLAARLEAARGHRGRAAKLLETAWEARPHPALRQAYLSLYGDLKPAERTARLMTLAEKVPDNPLSRQIEAEHQIALGNYDRAKTMIEPMLTEHPTARVFRLMAAAVRGLYGDQAAEPWLERAAEAPSEPVPGADGEFHFTTDGWRRLVREFGDHHRLAPPPLEDVNASMSREEIFLLAAPPGDQPVTPEEVPVEPVTAPENRTASETGDDEEAAWAAAAVKPSAEADKAAEAATPEASTGDDDPVKPDGDTATPASDSDPAADADQASEGEATSTDETREKSAT